MWQRILSALLKKQELNQEYEVLARGTVVLFAEPMNPRAEELLKAHAIEVPGIEATKLESVIENDTLVLAMTDALKRKITNEYTDLGNLYTLHEFIDEKEEIPNIYGRSQDEYEKIFERLQSYICKLARKLNTLDEKGISV